MCVISQGNEADERNMIDRRPDMLPIFWAFKILLQPDFESWVDV